MLSSSLPNFDPLVFLNDLLNTASHCAVAGVLESEESNVSSSASLNIYSVFTWLDFLPIEYEQNYPQ